MVISGLYGYISMAIWLYAYYTGYRYFSGIIWLLYGYYMVIIWFLYGSYMVISVGYKWL